MVYWWNKRELNWTDVAEGRSMHMCRHAKYKYQHLFSWGKQIVRNAPRQNIDLPKPLILD